MFDELKRLARRVAPELEHFYLVDLRVFDGLRMTPDGAYGVAIPSEAVSFDLQERIPNWGDPGPVIALNLEAIREQWGGEHFQAGMAAAFTHEVAHCLPANLSPLAPAISNLFDFAAARQRLDEQRAAVAAAADPSPDTPDNPHGWRFVRRVLHLWSRSRLAGFDTPVYGLFCGSLVFSVQEAHWLPPLLAEVVNMKDATFGQIEQAEPPAEFLQMWREYVHGYNKLRRQPNVS